MTFYTYPYETADNGLAEWQQMGLTCAPDRIVTGLGVSVVSGLTVRLAAGTARVGGFTFRNTVNFDITIPPNTGSGTRIDRLILRLTWTSAGSVDVAPAILSGASSSSPIGPTLTQQQGVGVWEIPVARWAVVAGAAAIVALVSDGPGPGSAVWTRTGMGVLTSTPTGVDSYTPNPAGAQGPQPASINGGDLVTSNQGLYSCHFQVLSTNGAPPAATSFIRLQIGAVDAYAAFNLLGRATISVPAVAVGAGSNITPSIYQTSGGTMFTDLVIALSKVT